MAFDPIARATAELALANSGTANTRTTAIDLFPNIANLSIDPSITVVMTSGFGAVGTGAGMYVCDAQATAALAASYPALCKSTINGRYFRLSGSSISVEAAGATGVAGTNDQPAIQQAISYANAMGIKVVRFEQEQYDLWCPARTSPWNGSWAPDGLQIVITADVQLVGVEGGPRGGTKLNMLNSAGGARSTITQTASGNNWLGAGIVIGPNAGATLYNYVSLRNLNVAGNIAYSLGSGNSGSNVLDKGLWLWNDEIAILDVRNCTFSGFLGELFYNSGTGLQNLYVENLTLHDSPQSCWNPGSLARVVAVNLEAYQSYQVAEVIGGAGHTYIGGSFHDSVTVTFIGSGGFNPSYPYWWPNRTTTTEPPWIDFHATRFANIGSLTFSSFCRGSIVTTDTGLLLGAYCDSSIHLDIDAICDQSNNLAALTFTGPANLTTQVSGAPVGTFQTPAQDIRVNLRLHRTAAAKAAGRAMNAVGFYGGLVDGNSVLVDVSGEIGLVAQYINAPVSGFVQPLIRLGACHYVSYAYGLNGIGTTPGSGATVTAQGVGCYLSPSGAGSSTITLSTTIGFADGQEFLLVNTDNHGGRLEYLPAQGNGYYLQANRTLYGYDDLIRLRWDAGYGRWCEAAYVTSQQLKFQGGTAITPASLASGAQATLGTVTVSGVAIGDFVTDVSASSATGGVRLWGEVTAANTVTIYAMNNSGSAYNPGATTYNVRVEKM